jgi:hypothetical protein
MSSLQSLAADSGFLHRTTKSSVLLEREREVAADLTAERQQRQAMVDATEGETIMRNWPTGRVWMSTMLVDQA